MDNAYTFDPDPYRIFTFNSDSYYENQWLLIKKWAQAAIRPCSKRLKSFYDVF